MIRTMQDLLNAGVNAFAVRLLAKDFEKMRAGLSGPVHVPIPLACGKRLWVTFSEEPPAQEVAPPASGG